MIPDFGLITNIYHVQTHAMKHLDELRKELTPICEDLEVYRLRYLKKAKNAQRLLIVPILLFLGSLAGMFFYDHLYFYFILGMIAAALLLAFIYIKLYNELIQAYQTKFKSLLIEKIVRGLYPNMKYQPSGFMPKNDFYKSGIFARKGRVDENYTGADYFEGIVSNVPIRFSEISTTQLRGKNTTVLFSGIFMVLDVEKEFEGITLILPDDYEQHFGELGVQLQASLAHIQNSELIYLEEHPDFEQKFRIFSTNTQETLNLLNEELLDNILWIRNRYNSEISIAFKDKAIYLAIHLGYRGLFDANIHKSLTEDDELFNRIYAELVTCFRLVKHFPTTHLN